MTETDDTHDHAPTRLAHFSASRSVNGRWLERKGFARDEEGDAGVRALRKREDASRRTKGGPALGDGKDRCYAREVEMADDLTIKILQELREEIRATRQEVRGTNERLDQTNERLDQTSERLDSVQALVARIPIIEAIVERTSQEQVFLNRWVRVLSRRDHRLEREMADVLGRVEILERRSGGQDS